VSIEDDNNCEGYTLLGHTLAGTGGYLVAEGTSCGDSSDSPGPTPTFDWTAFLFQEGSAARLDDDEIKGDSLIHIRGKPFDFFSWIRKQTPPPGCETAASPSETLSPDEKELLDLFEEWTPERIDGAVDVWIDPVTFLPVRVLSEINTYNDDDRITEREISLQLFSDYNTAELPGPLPAQ
jgi:hypothetical protein